MLGGGFGVYGGADHLGDLLVGGRCVGAGLCGAQLIAQPGQLGVDLIRAGSRRGRLLGVLVAGGDRLVAGGLGGGLRGFSGLLSFLSDRLGLLSRGDLAGELLVLLDEGVVLVRELVEPFLQGLEVRLGLLGRSLRTGCLTPALR